MKTLENSINRDKKISLYFCLVLALLSTFYGRATDWYASPTGSGNGTINSPFNLQTAFNSASILPGDRLFLRGGTYKGRFICNLAGTPTSKITVSSYLGEWAVLDGNILPSLDTVNTSVLNVVGGYVIFKDFKITYSNVVRMPTTTNYQRCNGIWHNSGEDCEFINLIVHDVPGTGVSSWKETGGTFFYGCIVYNNGYMTTTTARGNGPGFYIQNSSNKYRVFKNNIVFNNFHEGFECFSASSIVPFEFHKNITFDDNVAFNNGSPHRYVSNKLGANNLNVSNYSSDGSNQIKNINIINNTLYHNTDYTPPSSNGLACSLLVGNAYPCPSQGTNPGYGSENIFISDNFISGRNNHLNFQNINTITFQNNISIGRYVIVDENNKLNSKINATNWKFSNNSYYSSNSLYCNPPGQFATFRMTHYEYDSNCNTIGNEVNTDYYLYNYPGHGSASCFIDWVSIFGIDLNSRWRFLKMDENISRFPHHDGPWENPRNILSLTQNDYKPNQFKLALFYNPGNIQTVYLPYQPSNSMVSVNFSTYGISIPDGTTYIIKDVENLSNTSPFSGTITGNQITFDLNASGFDVPQGADFTNYATKTPNNFGVFLVEFASFKGCIANKTVTNLFPSGTLDFEQASNSIATNSTINSGSVGIYHAGNSITLTNGFHSKSGSKFRGYIEGCTQSFVGKVGNNNTKNNEEVFLNDLVEENTLKLYPNPVSNGTLFIDTTANAEKTVVIFDILGKQVLNTTTIDNAVNVNALRAGVYVVKITEEGKTATRKLIIE